MAKRAGPLATAFFWALEIGAVWGAVDYVHNKYLHPEKPIDINTDVGSGVTAALVVAYRERSRALNNG